MYETYIPGFTNELWGGAPETMSVDGGLTGSYQSLPTAQPGQTAPYVEDYQSLPTAQPVQTAPYSDGMEGLRPADIRAQLGAEMSITPRQMAAAPIANNGEVSPFTSNPYMVVNYGKEVNDPSFANTQNLDPTQAYRLVNQKTGEVTVSDPNDPTSLARLVLQANQLSGNSATKANWDIYSGDTSIASDRPNYTGGVLGALLQYGLPIGLSFIPGVGWAGSAALAGAGSTAGKLISGYDLGDALKSGALTAVTAGLMKAPILGGGGSIGGTISNALGEIPGVGDALKAVSGGGGGYDPVTNTITAIGNTASPLISNVASGLIGSGAFTPDYSGLGQFADPSYTGIEAPTQEQPLEQQFDDILVKGNLPAGELPAIPVSPSSPAPVSGYDPVLNEITAVGDTSKPITDAQDAVSAVVPPLTSVNIPADAGNVTPTDNKGGLSTLDYIKLASLGIGALGDLFGGNKNAPGATISGNMGALNPIFSAQLPGANLPGLTGSTGGARPAAQSGLNTAQDWYRYGYGPEQSFFNYVPMGQPNTSKAYTGYAEGGSTGYGEGGGLSHYVEGPGDGREDKIPAMLSDGEYVMDAETVALLGNGSNKAGADLLDKFRVNVRKHKGRELARGDFSKDAKKPEQYLAGGRA